MKNISQVKRGNAKFNLIKPQNEEMMVNLLSNCLSRKIFKKSEAVAMKRFLEVEKNVWTIKNCTNGIVSSLKNLSTEFN